MRTVVTNREAHAKIAARAPFRNGTGSFSGDPIPADQPWRASRYLGYLPKGFHASLANADYVVYSYSTPIGWHVPGEGWHVPEVRYSATTSCRHQPELHRAVTVSVPAVPSWRAVEGSATAANILRSIRAGYAVVVKGRTRRVVDLVIATGEAVREGDSLVPADGSHVRNAA